jgi:acetoin utilization deacetylase AcuC-like enzyme
MTLELSALSRELEAPLGFVLEGGYDLEALAASVVAVLEAARNGEGGESVEPEALSSRARAHYARWWTELSD